MWSALSVRALVVVVVVVRTGVFDVCVCPKTHHEMHLIMGGRVPVDTTPGPVPVCRALKNPPVIPAVEADSWNWSLRHHSDVHPSR